MWNMISQNNRNNIKWGCLRTGCVLAPNKYHRIHFLLSSYVTATVHSDLLNKLLYMILIFVQVTSVCKFLSDDTLSSSSHSFYHLFYHFHIITNYVYANWRKLTNNKIINVCCWMFQMVGMIFSIGLCRNIGDGLAQGHWEHSESDLVKNHLWRTEGILTAKKILFCFNNCQCFVCEWLFNYKPK
jgi:hypothetical protein